MDTTSLSIEQKIDEIHSMLRAEQSRTSRAFWYRMLKWALILGIAYFTLSNPGYVTDKIMEYLQPIIIEQMQTIMSDKKDGLLDQMKKILPTATPQPQEQY